jgi:tetratricopeptide (TPR) repeat protein
VDVAGQARFLQAFGWLSVPGLVFGGLIGYVLGGAVGMVLGAFLGIALVGGVGAGLIVMVTERVGGMARVLYNPSGESTPHRREYSYAKSLVARGACEEAVEAYRAAISEDPRDPAPYVAIARILRDELGRPADAAAWFRRARAEAQLDAGTGVLVARELIELYRTKLGEPLRAAPELARLAETAPDTPDGRWAAAELAELKRSIAETRARS